MEKGDSTFVFPLAHVRFVEIRASSVEAAGPKAAEGGPAADNEPVADIGPAEILRRVRQV